MNIALTNEYFPPFAPGGAEWSMLALARALARSHRVTVITPNYGAAPYEERDGVRIFRFDYPARIPPGQTTLRFRWLANPLFYQLFARQIGRVARRLSRETGEPLDILHAQNKYALPGTWLASRRLAIPVVYTIRDTSMICPLGQCFIQYQGGVHPRCGQWGHWWRYCRPTYIDNYLPGRRSNLKVNASLIWLAMDTRIRRWFFRRTDGIAGVSEGILRVYREAGLLGGLPTRAVYNLPPEESALPGDQVEHRLGLEGHQAVLYAGRFSPGKGTADLVAAADIVARRVPSARFLFAGQGELRASRPGAAPAARQGGPSCRAPAAAPAARQGGPSCRAPAAAPHLCLLGQVPHDELLRLYHLADLVVVPSRQPEPLARVALEAMAAGRALVGTRVGGTPELIEHGLNGRLVPRANPVELAEAIIDLLLDDARRAQMGRASLELVRTRFATEATLDRLLEFYRQAIAGRRGPSRQSHGQRPSAGLSDRFASRRSATPADGEEHDAP